MSGLRLMETAPAKLESICHVFAIGLDVTTPRAPFALCSDSSLLPRASADAALLSCHSAYALSLSAGFFESHSRAAWLTEGAVRGLQIFYTRTSPSRSFDLLSDDFDYVVLLLMITGLATLTGSFWWWSKNKDLASAWR